MSAHLHNTFVILSFISTYQYFSSIYTKFLPSVVTTYKYKFARISLQISSLHTQHKWSTLESRTANEHNCHNARASVIWLWRQQSVCKTIQTIYVHWKYSRSNSAAAPLVSLFRIIDSLWQIITQRNII